MFPLKNLHNFSHVHNLQVKKNPHGPYIDTHSYTASNYQSSISSSDESSLSSCKQVLSESSSTMSSAWKLSDALHPSHLREGLNSVAITIWLYVVRLLGKASLWLNIWRCKHINLVRMWSKSKISGQHEVVWFKDK